jgi:L-fuconolactonase
MATAKEQSAPALEAPLEPGLAICDPHHHLWDRPNDRYFLEDLIQDTSSGHNIAVTVAVECRAMYRKEGPAEMKPIGESEFLYIAS